MQCSSVPTPKLQPEALWAEQVLYGATAAFSNQSMAPGEGPCAGIPPEIPLHPSWSRAELTLCPLHLCTLIPADPASWDEQWVMMQSTLNISQLRFQLSSYLEQHSLIPIHIATGERFVCGHISTFLPVAALCYPRAIHGSGGVSEHRDYTASGQMERGS